MKELLIRSISGLLMGIVLLTCVFISSWTWFALLLFIIAVGTFEMSRLQQMNSITGIIIGEALSLSFFALPALVALQVITPRWLLLEMLIALMPFLYALFSVKHDAKPIFTYLYASLAFLSLPSSLMLFMYREDLFGTLAGSKLIILVFCLLWVNDVFAYLTGKLLGRHKLFSRFQIHTGKCLQLDIFRWCHFNIFFFSTAKLRIFPHITSRFR